jgi:hypothetical protein
MLLRISLIVAIIAGLAVGGLNFVMVKDKVTKLADDRDNEKKMKVDAQTELASTKTKLKSTETQLASTKAELEATTTAKNQALTELDAKTKQADRLTADLAKTRKERDDSQAELARYVATGYTPERIMAMGKEYNEQKKHIDGLMGENKMLGQRIVALDNELMEYRDPQRPVRLPADLHGKVVVMDPKWNFVILDVGQDQGVLERGELLVNRNGKLVAKVKVRTVQKYRCIANVLPGWQLGDVIEGDQVIPAHPAS